MFSFVIACLLIMAGIVALVVAGRRSAARPAGKGAGSARIGARIAGTVVLLLGVVVVLLDCTTTVSARTVGVETSFGKPVSALPNGVHFVRPWASIDDTWDGTVQTVTYNPTVRLANGTTARVDVSVQWQIDTGQQFITLWRQYRTFDNIQSNVLKRQTTNALNEVFETFNPLATLDANGTQTVQVSTFAPQVQQKVAAAMPPGLTIKNVTLPQITYDSEVQNQINSIIAAAAATRVAVQNEQTAKAQASANNTLANGNTSGGVLYQQCLSMTQSALKAGETLPEGWSCGTPGAPVVIPAK